MICIALFSLVACGAGPKKPSLNKSDNQGSGDGTGSTGPVGVPTPLGKTLLKAELQKPVSDPLIHTFGAAELRPTSHASAAISVDRFLFVTDSKKLAAEDKSALSALCQNIGLSSKADSMSEAANLGSEAKPTYLVWRSFYKQETKDLIDKLVVGGQDSILCLAKITVTDDAKVAPYFIAFEPAPTSQDKVLGSIDGTAASKMGLMVPVEPKVKIAEEQLIAVAGEGNFKLGVKAISKDSVKVSPDGVPTGSCLLNGASSTALVNPTSQLVAKFKLSSESSVTAGEFKLQAVDGRNLKACANVKTSNMDGAISVSHDCKNYQAVKDEGIEAGCQWDVSVSNKDDAENVTTVRVALPKVEFKVFNEKAVDAATALIPKEPKNPVRTRQIKFVNFGAAALSAMEMMFDLWGTTEPKTYASDVIDFMKEINLENCGSGILGYARLGSAKLTMCFLAGLSDSALAKKDDPGKTIMTLITASHEIRHAVKWRHDKDDRNYPACGGTAYSAITMHALLVTCSEPYCIVLRKMAQREYISELKYSLNGDNRRFQGQCKKWSDEIGLKDSQL